MPLEQIHVIDAIGRDEATGQTVLIMTESRPWTGSARHLFELQEKVNAYLGFALDGEMDESYPELAGRPLRLQLDCAIPPDESALALIEKMRAQLAFQQIDLAIRINGPAPGK